MKQTKRPKRTTTPFKFSLWIEDEIPFGPPTKPGEDRTHEFAQFLGCDPEPIQGDLRKVRDEQIFVVRKVRRARGMFWVFTEVTK